MGDRVSKQDAFSDFEKDQYPEGNFLPKFYLEVAGRVNRKAPTNCRAEAAREAESRPERSARAGAAQTTMPQDAYVDPHETGLSNQKRQSLRLLDPAFSRSHEIKYEGPAIKCPQWEEQYLLSAALAREPSPRRRNNDREHAKTICQRDRWLLDIGIPLHHSRH